jgi:thiol-disulfide isomerase/thioredoxin
MSGDGRQNGDDQQASLAGRYSRFVGVVFLAVIVIAFVTTLTGEDDGILGTDPEQRGSPLPEFAVPELLGSREGDANVYQDDCATDRRPCPEEDRVTPACKVELSEVIRVCDFYDRPLVISFWFTRGGDCLPTQDVFDRVARRFDDRVGFLSINIRDDRDEARRIVRERGWSVPVGYDADGAVATLYRVGVCPTVAFAFPGGVLRDAKIGSEELGEEQLTRELEDLIRASRQREREEG